MCCSDVTNNPHTRRMMVLANLFLVLGLLPRLFLEQQVLHTHPMIDFFCGLFLGCSTVMNLELIRRRRSRQS